jgi:hypothetical protein
LTVTGLDGAVAEQVAETGEAMKNIDRSATRINEMVIRPYLISLFNFDPPYRKKSQD